MYKFIRVTHMQNPPSCGGNWEYGRETVVSFSRSPKLAQELRGVTSYRMEGEDGVPIMVETRLERDGKVITKNWS